MGFIVAVEATVRLVGSRWAAKRGWQLRWGAAKVVAAAVGGSRWGKELRWGAAEMAKSCGGGQQKW